MSDLLAKRIRLMRKACDLTQEELGAKIGVTKATVNKYESAVVVNLKRTVIEKLAAALNTNPGYLMEWTDKNGNPDGIKKPLTEEEQELLRIYRELEGPNKIILLVKASALLKGENNG